jgi:hypothetical protein
LSDYPIGKAWNRVAKMLFPAHDLVRTYDRDCWLIERYPAIDNPYKHQPASLLPGGITYLDSRNFAPKELIAEIDQAYFRRSLRKKVSLWFTRRGFDLKQPIISKQDFEAVFAKPSVQKESAASRAKPTSETDLATFKRNYLAGGGRPFATPFAVAARSAGISATRKRLRAVFPARPRGRPIKSPK